MDAQVGSVSGGSSGRGCPSLLMQMRPSGDYVVLQFSAPLWYAAQPSSDELLKPNTCWPVLILRGPPLRIVVSLAATRTLADWAFGSNPVESISRSRMWLIEFTTFIYIDTCIPK